MTAFKQAMVVTVAGMLLLAGGCVSQARHSEVVQELSAAKAELATQTEAMSGARGELTEIKKLVAEIDNARKVAKVDVQQAVASVEKLQAWVNNTMAAVERLEAALGSDELMDAVTKRLDTAAAKLDTNAEEAPAVAKDAK